MAMKILRGATTIESAAVSDGGEPSCYVMAYRRMLQSPRADKQFKRLFATAETPAGRLYALAGLYWTDPEEFEGLLPRFLADEQTRVPQLFTCLGSEETVADVAARIEDGFWPEHWAYGLLVEGAPP
jgi:hypothetical protein